MLHIETNRTDEAVLSANVVSAHRLPIALNQFTALCRHAPDGARLEQRGEWVVIIDPARKATKPLAVSERRVR